MSMNSQERPYLVNVWRLLFTCSPGKRGWEPIDSDPRAAAMYLRIFNWGIEIGRDLDFDLTSAQIAVERHLKREEWITSQIREVAHA